MDDEIRDAVKAFRAATTTPRHDATRRRIWRELQREIGPEVAPRDRSPWLVTAAVVAMAAGLVLALGRFDGDDGVHDAETPRGDQAIDASTEAHAREAAARGGARADIVPAELDAARLRPHVEDVVPTPAAPPTSRAPSARTPTSSPSPVVDPIAVPEARDALRREAALLMRAREAALADDPVGARAALDAHAQQFPRGALAPERWTLATELHCDAGDHAAAARVAAAFAHAHPDTPSAVALRRRPCDPMTNRDPDGHTSAEAR